MKEDYHNKLTEDDVVEILLNKLKNDGWNIINQCFGQTRGHDIEAEKDGKILIIEAKGARSNDYSPTKKRDFFNSGQIKSHFGRAMVKLMTDMEKNPHRIYAIAHPKDELIEKTIGAIIPQLEKLNIKHYWVTNDKI